MLHNVDKRDLKDSALLLGIDETLVLSVQLRRFLIVTMKKVLWTQVHCFAFSHLGLTRFEY